MNKPKKIEQPKPIKHYLYADIKSELEHSHRGEGDWADWEQTYNSTFGGIQRREPTGGYYHKRIPVGENIFNSDTVGVVVITYSDGDSFGTAYGNMCVGCISDNQNVIDGFLESYKSDYEYNKLKEKYKDSGDYFECFYTWGGYFNRVSNIEVQYIKLDPVEPLKRY